MCEQGFSTHIGGVDTYTLIAIIKFLFALTSGGDAKTSPSHPLVPARHLTPARASTSHLVEFSLSNIYSLAQLYSEGLRKCP